jgi:hypothetical protein
MQAPIYLSLDGGVTGLPALYILEEMLSRLAFDLKSDQELLIWRHFEIMIATGPGGWVHSYTRLTVPYLHLHIAWL